MWSLWPGYLDRSPWIVELLKTHGIELEVIHASGHARVADLQELVRVVNPGRVVPIHTNAPELFPALFPQVTLEPDLLWWGV